MLLCKVDVDKHYFSSPFYYETGLMVAAKRGFTDIVSELANKTNKIDYQLRKYSALMLAAKNGHHQAVSILLEHGANLNAKNIFKQNALCIAVENCHGPVVSVLLENGADPNTRDEWDGSTVLIKAAKHCQPQIISKLLENGADPNMISDFYTPLMMAAEKGNIQACQILLENGADVNVVTYIDYIPERQNALSLAGKNGNLDIFAFLLDNGADMSSLNNVEDGYTPMIFAIKSYFKDNMTAINLIHILLDHGADINLRNEYGRTALMSLALYDGKENILAALLDNGADVNLQNNVFGKFYNYTALMYAAEEGKEKTVSMLLDSGADPNLQNGHGQSALSLAGASRKKKNIEIVSSLIEHGADVNLKDNLGLTALMIAIAHSKYEIMSTLLNNGADSDIIYGEFTPLMLALRTGTTKAMETLLDHGLDVNQQNEAGMSSLFRIRYRSPREKIDILLAHGADVNLRDNNGQTPLMYGLGRWIFDEDMLAKLMEHGADI